MITFISSLRDYYLLEFGGKHLDYKEFYYWYFKAVRKLEEISYGFLDLNDLEIRRAIAYQIEVMRFIHKDKISGLACVILRRKGLLR